MVQKPVLQAELGRGDTKHEEEEKISFSSFHPHPPTPTTPETLPAPLPNFKPGKQVYGRD